MVMATDHVEVFDNQIEDNQTASVLIVSYLAIDRKINDPSFDAIPEHVSIHNNRIAGGGTNPQGVLAELLKAALGDKFPDVMWDGVINPAAGSPRSISPTTATSLSSTSTSRSSRPKTSKPAPTNPTPTPRSSAPRSNRFPK